MNDTYNIPFDYEWYLQYFIWMVKQLAMLNYCYLVSLYQLLYEFLLFYKEALRCLNLTVITTIS